MPLSFSPRAWVWIPKAERIKPEWIKGPRPWVVVALRHDQSVTPIDKRNAYTDPHTDGVQ